jgi:hypothetical protein
MKIWTIWVVIVGVCIAATVALAGVLAVAVVRFGESLDAGLRLERRHLEPIPIPPEACPALEPVRVEAAQARAVWTDQLGAQPKPWPEFSAALGARLDRLAFAVQAAIPAVPPPVAAQFEVVVREVASGRQALATATDVSGYVAGTSRALFDGVGALGNASDLVGTACGPQLYAGSALG